MEPALTWMRGHCLHHVMWHVGLMQADVIRADPQLSVLLRRGARFSATGSASASHLLWDLMCKTNICILYIVLRNTSKAAFGNVWVGPEAQWEMQANDPNPLCLPLLICIWFCSVIPVVLAGRIVGSFCFTNDMHLPQYFKPSGIIAQCTQTKH